MQVLRTTLAGILLLALIPACQTDPVHPDIDPSATSPSATVSVLELGGSKSTSSDLRMHGANGLAMRDSETLMVGSLFGREVTGLTTADGAPAERLGPAEGVEGVGDLCYDRSGALVWSNFWTGDVKRRLPDGAVQTVHVGEGVGALAVGVDGVYVARRFLGDGVYRLDPDFASSPVLVSEPGDVGGLAVDACGRVIASLWSEGTIVHLLPHQGGTAVLADGFSVPAGIAFDPDGKLLVAEHMTGVLWRLTLPRFPGEHGEIHDPGISEKGAHDREVVAELGPGLADVIVEERGHCFAANSQDGTVTKIYAWGSTRQVVEPGMILPGGLSVCPNGSGDVPLWVADAWTLRSFDRESGEMLDVHRCMLAVNGFTAPMTVALCGDDLIVSSWLGSVQRINPSVCGIIESYEFDPACEIPLNSVRFGDGLVVAGLVSGSVFDPSARAVYGDGFEVPTGLAAHEGSLWVADRATGRVWQIAVDSAPLPEPMLVAEGLDAPEGLAVLHAQALLVVETGAGRLTKINLLNGTTAVIAEGLEIGLEAAPGRPETWQFNGVTVADATTAYVASDVANLVYKVHLHEGSEHVVPVDPGVGTD